MSILTCRMCSTELMADGEGGWTCPRRFDHPGARHWDAERLAMRSAWEAGFRLCRSYGDNHHHFDGEQKERHWFEYLAGTNGRPVAAKAEGRS